LPRAFEPDSQEDDIQQKVLRLLQTGALPILRRRSEAVTLGIAIVIELGLAKMAMEILLPVL
jgi:hypothetical protein